MLANAGHFDIEIDLPALRAAATGGVHEVLPMVEQYDLGGRRLNLLASGRVVNLAAGQGHPAAVMDMSFANQALAVEHLVRHPGRLGPGVHPVPEAVDREVARLKLESLGVEIDQALAVEHLVRHPGKLGPGVHPVPEAVDREVARLKLESLGVEIDVLSDAQRDYLRSWTWVCGPAAPDRTRRGRLVEGKALDQENLFG